MFWTYGVKYSKVIASNFNIHPFTFQLEATLMHNSDKMSEFRYYVRKLNRVGLVSAPAFPVKRR